MFPAFFFVHLKNKRMTSHALVLCYLLDKAFFKTSRFSFMMAV
jgi:hypothetical protein